MSKEANHLYDFGPFRLDAKRQRVLTDGEPLALPPKAVELLTLLVERQGQVVEKDFLLATLWPDTVVEEANLTQNIYLLRKALGQAADGQSFIETFSKRGYKFVPPVQAVAEEPPLIVTKHTQSRLRITEGEVSAAAPLDVPTPQPFSLPPEAVPAPRLARAYLTRRQWTVVGVVGVLLASVGF
jgi:DNA-binding winged helix-turn-helix (wHTH) protein